MMTLPVINLIKHKIAAISTQTSVMRRGFYCLAATTVTSGHRVMAQISER
jgi:hypothetical protein